MVSEPGGWSGGRVQPTLMTSALMALSTVFAVSLSAFVFAAVKLEIGAPAALASALLLAAIYLIVLVALPGHGHPRFGYANLVTAIRAAIVSFVCGTVFLAEGFQWDPRVEWAVVAAVLVALVLDGIDGRLARRLGQASDFGARFDMEVDALLILILSGAALLLDKAGWWVLLIGLMRYGFVFAQVFLPALSAPLPPSFRRKTVCVLQVAGLCALVVPGVAPPISTVIAAISLAALAGSFAVDVLHLMRRPEPSA